MTTTAPPAIKAEDQAAVLELVQTVVKSWKAQDAAALGGAYAEDVSMILPGTHLQGRDVAQKFMTEAFAGRWKDTEVLGLPLELRYLHDDVIMLISQGGAHTPGATEVTEANAIRAMWIFVKRDGKWTTAAYGNTPKLGSIPIPSAKQ